MRPVYCHERLAYRKADVFTGRRNRPTQSGGVAHKKQSEAGQPYSGAKNRERDEFPDFYADMDRAGMLFVFPARSRCPVTIRAVLRGLVTSKGPGAINRQLDTFKAAVGRRGRGGVRLSSRARLSRPLSNCRSHRRKRQIRRSPVSLFPQPLAQPHALAAAQGCHLCACRQFSVMAYHPRAPPLSYALCATLALGSASKSSRGGRKVRAMATAPRPMPKEPI
jgi:hypothetical protein